MATTLEKCITSLILKPPTKPGLFFRTMLFAHHPYEGNVGTACTDGKRIIVDPAYYATLSIEEGIGVLVHEMCHTINKHHLRIAGRDRVLLNIAADLAINDGILDSGFRLPSGVLLPATLGLPKNLTMDEYYNMLNKMGKGRAKIGGDKGSGKGGDAPSNMQDVADPGECGSFVRPDLQDGAEAAAMADEVDRNILRSHATAAGQQAGKLPSFLEKIIADLLPPQVSWQDQLKHLVHRQCHNRRSWHRPSRRALAYDIILPGRGGTTMEHIAISWDSSGSCFSRAFQQTFLGEMYGILAPWPDMDVTLFFNDTEVKGVQTFKAKQIKAKTSFKVLGGGGTSHVPVFEFVDGLRKRPTVLICLTDLYTSFPDHAPRYPVVWCIVDNDRGKPPWGEAVHIDSKRVKTGDD